MNAAGEPMVGIFWFITTATSNCLLVDAVSCDGAEAYGDFLTHGGHHEFWTTLSLLSVFALRARHLPDAMKWSEYEEWPRGRVELHQPTQRFILYADRKLLHATTIAQIMDQFFLPLHRVDVRADHHCVSLR